MSEEWQALPFAHLWQGLFITFGPLKSVPPSCGTDQLCVSILSPQEMHICRWAVTHLLPGTVLDLGSFFPFPSLHRHRRRQVWAPSPSGASFCVLRGSGSDGGNRHTFIWPSGLLFLLSLYNIHHTGLTRLHLTPCNTNQFHTWCWY